MTSPRRTLSGRPAPQPSPWRWAWYLPGVSAVLWGFYGLLTADSGPAPPGWAVFVALGVAGHDLLLAPLAIGVGLALSGVAPRPLRAPLQAGLFATGALALAAVPNVLGYGVSEDVPSALPFNYAGRVVVLLAVVWVVVVVWVVLRWRSARAQAG